MILQLYQEDEIIMLVLLEAPTILTLLTTLSINALEAESGPPSMDAPALERHHRHSHVEGLRFSATPGARL